MEQICLCFLNMFQSPTQSVAAHIESYLLHMYYTSQLDNLYDNREIDQLELDWITWQRDYDSRIYRTNIKYLSLLYIHMRGPMQH